MALTYTLPADLGKTMPKFQLTGVDDKIYLSDSLGPSPCTVVAFFCNHCPYVKAVEDRFINWAREAKKSGVQVIAICANDPSEFPEDDLPEMKKRAREKNYSFPYLQDLSQEVAKAFGAVCTPDFFVYDRNLKLAYRGRFDDSWKNPAQVQHQDLAEAVRQVLQGQIVNFEQIPAMGCSIKWRER